MEKTCKIFHRHIPSSSNKNPQIREKPNSQLEYHTSSWRTCGPCSLDASHGLPTDLFCALSVDSLTNSSYTVSWTNTLDPAIQHWPWLKNKPKWHNSTACFKSQSSNTTWGLFPPSSRVTFFKFVRPAACWISFPTLQERWKVSYNRN